MLLSKHVPKGNPEKRYNPLDTFISPVFRRAFDFKDRIAIKDRHGQYTYGRLLAASEKLAIKFKEKIGEDKQQRIAFLCPNDASYILAQWACWITGNIAVPLSPLHPAAMLEYFVRDSEANLIVTTPEFLNVIQQVLQKTGRALIILDDSLRIQAAASSGVSDTISKDSNSNTFASGESNPLDGSTLGSDSSVFSTANVKNIDLLSDVDIKTDRPYLKLPENFFKNSDALIIYTSGSTGQPKGAVITHKNLDAQIKSLVKAWNWTSNDAILHTLPLHHIHGVVNALLCPLAVGARCVMLPSFDACEIWRQLLGVKLPTSERVNMFMGVPTMYAKLVDKYIQSLTKNERMVDYVRAECSQKFRLFVSGSAPLPSQIFQKWEFITGHKILERYGMTETGMVLTNSLAGDRKPGSVGNPFPGVEVRIVDNKGNVLVEGSSADTKIIAKDVKTLSGELQVRGSNVFKEYYKRPQQTDDAFVDDWFKTGDQALYDDKRYSIQGRQSVDIIKTGGYKVSAIHVETALRDHPDINDVAVLGLNDDTWGQKVAAVVESSKGDELDLVKLKEWAKTKLPPYEVPTVICCVKSIPRNTLGKVNKKDLITVVFPETKRV